MNLMSFSSERIRRRANARNVSFRISLRWPIYIINPVDGTKLSFSKIAYSINQLYFNNRLNPNTIWNILKEKVLKK